MAANSPPSRFDWSGVHAALFFIALFLLVPRLPRTYLWPWYLLAPLLVYAAVVVPIAPLRRSCTWLAAGRWDRTAVAATAGIVIVSSVALAAFHSIFAPDASLLAAQLPTSILGSAILAGAWFSVVNASLEELAIRGLLYDALESLWGWPTAIAASAVAFGAAHAKGYPPGIIGGILAGTYGLALGWLRWRTRGVAAPIVAHIFADATIFAMIVER